MQTTKVVRQLVLNQLEKAGFYTGNMRISQDQKGFKITCKFRNRITPDGYTAYELTNYLNRTGYFKVTKVTAKNKPMPTIIPVTGKRAEEQHTKNSTELKGTLTIRFEVLKWF